MFELTSYTSDWTGKCRVCFRGSRQPKLWATFCGRAQRLRCGEWTTIEEQAQKRRCAVLGGLEVDLCLCEMPCQIFHISCFQSASLRWNTHVGDMGEVSVLQHNGLCESLVSRACLVLMHGIVRLFLLPCGMTHSCERRNVRCVRTHRSMWIGLHCPNVFVWACYVTAPENKEEFRSTATPKKLKSWVQQSSICL